MSVVLNSGIITPYEVPLYDIANLYIGGLAELYIGVDWTTSSLMDFSVTSTRRRFIDGISKCPVYLGDSGEFPLQSDETAKTLVYMSGDAALWLAGTNKGGAGNLNVVFGEVTNSTLEPVCAYNWVVFDSPIQYVIGDTDLDVVEVIPVTKRSQFVSYNAVTIVEPTQFQMVTKDYTYATIFAKDPPEIMVKKDYTVAYNDAVINIKVTIGVDTATYSVTHNDVQPVEVVAVSTKSYTIAYIAANLNAVENIVVDTKAYTDTKIAVTVIEAIPIDTQTYTDTKIDLVIDESNIINMELKDYSITYFPINTVIADTKDYGITYIAATLNEEEKIFVDTKNYNVTYITLVALIVGDIVPVDNTLDSTITYFDVTIDDLVFVDTKAYTASKVDIRVDEFIPIDTKDYTITYSTTTTIGNVLRIEIDTFDGYTLTLPSDINEIDGFQDQILITWTP